MNGTNSEVGEHRNNQDNDDRGVEFSGDRDGMAWLNVLMSAPDAVAVYTRLTNIAVSLQCPDEERTLTQLRADVFRDLLLDDDPEILAALAALETVADDPGADATETDGAEPASQNLPAPATRLPKAT